MGRRYNYDQFPPAEEDEKMWKRKIKRLLRLLDPRWPPKDDKAYSE